MFNGKELIRNADVLAAMILNSARGYMQRYKLSALTSYVHSVRSLYNFSKGHGLTDDTEQNYTERTIKLITDRSLNFSDSELYAAYCYYDVSLISMNPKIKDFEKQLKTEISEQNAYKREVLNSTVEQRALISHSCIMLSDEIIRYIEYWETFEGQDKEYLLYNNLYFLGYIAGKRAERARRKAATRA